MTAYSDSTIIAYLQWELADGERVAFEAALHEQENLQRRVIVMKAMLDDMSRARIQAQLHALPAAIDEPGWLSARRLAVAAAVLLLGTIGIGLWWSSPTRKAKALYTEQYRRPVPLRAMRMGSDSPSGLLNHIQYGMDNYAQGNFEAALADFHALEADFPQHDSLQFFIATTYLELGKADSAIFYYEQVLSQPAGDYTDEAAWYKLMSLLKAGRVKQARQWIAAAVMVKNRKYSKQIQAVKKALEP